MESTLADSFSHILTLETYELVRSAGEFSNWVKWVEQEFQKDEKLHSLYKNQKHILIKRFKDEALPLSKWLAFHSDVIEGRDICLLSSSQKFDAVLMDKGLVTDRIEVTWASSYKRDEIKTSEDKIKIIQNVLSKKLSKNYPDPTILLVYSHYFDELDLEELKARFFNQILPKAFKSIYFTGNSFSLNLLN